MAEKTASPDNSAPPAPTIPFERLYVFVPGEPKPKVYTKAQVVWQYLNLIQVVDEDGDTLTYTGFPIVFEEPGKEPGKESKE